MSDHHPPEGDRRENLRREEDRDLRDQVEALNFAMFGDPRSPETGLMSRHQLLERKIDRLTWAAVSATVALAAAVVTNTFG